MSAVSAVRAEVGKADLSEFARVAKRTVAASRTVEPVREDWFGMMSDPLRGETDLFRGNDYY